MSAAQKLKELRVQKAELLKEASAAANDEVKFEETKAKIEATNKAIDRQQFLLDAEMAEPVAADPEREAHVAAEKAGKPGVFKSLGEQLQAVHAAARGRVDPRLFHAAAPGLGLNESTPDAGGFAVQQDFSSEILQRMYDVGAILSRVRRVRVSGNGIVLPAVNETSRATGSRLGGIQGYWVTEGAAPTASRPQLRQINMRLEKVAALGYATDELLADAAALGGVLQQGATEELLFLTEDAIVNGDGVGKPLGVMNSNALVTVAAEGAQTADTVNATNIAKMWARSWSRARTSASWHINQAVESQFPVMTLGDTPVYLPPGGMSEAPYGRVFGRELIPTEYCAAIGDLGDILLAQWSEYLVIEKGGVESASSMHVAFDTFEQAFRFSYRVNGQPTWNSALTPYKGSDTISPFVTLAAR